MDRAEVYFAVSAEGYKRGPYRATRAEAEADCAASGEVRSMCGSLLLQQQSIPWDLVDRLYGIEQVWIYTTDLRLMDLAEQALRQRGREVPWQ